mmetsp:Transcript_7577/g.24078  ORF Transcript_7577/g.24078 Transcript_7577/m.24078 type:complete len:326 (+) Transcript_7577:109-1086(+)
MARRRQRHGAPTACPDCIALRGLGGASRRPPRTASFGERPELVEGVPRVLRDGLRQPGGGGRGLAAAAHAPPRALVHQAQNAGGAALVGGLAAAVNALSHRRLLGRQRPLLRLRGRGLRGGRGLRRLPLRGVPLFEAAPGVLQPALAHLRLPVRGLRPGGPPRAVLDRESLRLGGRREAPGQALPRLALGALHRLRIHGRRLLRRALSGPRGPAPGRMRADRGERTGAVGPGGRSAGGGGPGRGGVGPWRRRVGGPSDRPGLPVARHRQADLVACAAAGLVGGVEPDGPRLVQPTVIGSLQGVAIVRVCILLVWVQACVPIAAEQ